MADRYPSQWRDGGPARARERERDDVRRSPNDVAPLERSAGPAGADRPSPGRDDWQGGEGREPAPGTPAGVQSGSYTAPGSFGTEHRGYAHAHNRAGGSYGGGHDMQGGGNRHDLFAPQRDADYGTQGYGGQARGDSTQSPTHGAETGYGPRGGYGGQGGYGPQRSRDEARRAPGGFGASGNADGGGPEIGYGGYGPDGGGYGSQANYAAHPYAAKGYGTQGGYGSAEATQSTRNARGPKGYTRSDERMREDICEHLMHSTHIDSSEVTVEVAAGNVTLEGTVPDRRMKHAIEDMAGACPGVNDVDNRIRVARSGAQTNNAWNGAEGGTDPHSARVPGPIGPTEDTAENPDTGSRGPGDTTGLSGRSTSTSSTAKPARD